MIDRFACSRKNGAEEEVVAPAVSLGGDGFGKGMD